MFSLSKIITAAAAIAAALALNPMSAAAQSATSTWERITTTKKLRLGCAISEPYCYRDPTNSTEPGAVVIAGVTWRGMSPNVARVMAEALGAELEIVETTYGTASAGLQADQFDIVLGYDTTTARAAAVDFPAQSMFWGGVAAMAAPQHEFNTWQELAETGLRIGVVSGGTPDMAASEYVPAERIMRFANTNEVIAALQSNRVDVAVHSSIGLALATTRVQNMKLTVPTPRVLQPTTGAVKKEVDPRWLNFIRASMSHLEYTGIAAGFMKEAFAFRGVDLTKYNAIQQP